MILVGKYCKGALTSRSSRKPFRSLLFYIFNAEHDVVTHAGDHRFSSFAQNQYSTVVRYYWQVRKKRKIGSTLEFEHYSI